MAGLPVDCAELRRLACRAEVDPRTLAKVIRGEPVRGMAGRRALRVLRAEGIEPLSAADDGAAGDAA